MSGVGQTGGQCTGWHFTKYYLAVQVDMKDNCSWTETLESCCLTLLPTIQSGPRVSNIEVPYKCVYWSKVIQLDFDFRENLEESCCLVHMSVVQVYHIFMRTTNIADANTSLYYYIQVGQHNRNSIDSKQYRNIYRRTLESCCLTWLCTTYTGSPMSIKYRSDSHMNIVKEGNTV